MFTKPPTRAPWYILIKSFFVAIAQSYLRDLSHTFQKDWNYFEVKLHGKSASFSRENGQTSGFSFFTLFLTLKTLSQISGQRPYSFRFNFTKIEALSEEKASVNDFGRTVPSEKYCCRYNRLWRHFVATTTPMSLQPWAWQIFIFI